MTFDPYKFKKEYNAARLFCPKCGSNSYTTTLVGYILDYEKPEDYKDRNMCTCEKCGDKHIFHDRVNEHYIRMKKLEEVTKK